MVCRKDAGVRFGSKADTQTLENLQMAGLGTQDAQVNVRFRPKADIPHNHIQKSFLTLFF